LNLSGGTLLIAQLLVLDATPTLATSRNDLSLAVSRWAYFSDLWFFWHQVALHERGWLVTNLGNLAARKQPLTNNRKRSPVSDFSVANVSNVDLSRGTEGPLTGSPRSIRWAFHGGLNGRYPAGISANSDSALGTLKSATNGLWRAMNWATR